MAGAFPDTYKKYLNGSTEDVWIETGTYKGTSVQRALDFGFREIHTIEVDLETFESLNTDHPELCSDTRVHRYLGSSRKLLPTIVESINDDRYVVFWLDAHFMGYSTQHRDEISECPLLDELKTVTSRSWQHRPMVCIDDVNMFMDHLWISDHDRSIFTREHWPGESQIIEVLQGWNHYETENILYFY